MKVWIKNISKNIYVFEEVRIASRTFVIMLIPVFTFSILLELFVPKSSIVSDANHDNIAIAPNLKIYILYLTASAAHIIHSLIVIIFLLRKLFKNNTHIKSKLILKRLLFSIFLITILFLRVIPSSHFFIGIHIFSLIPFTLSDIADQVKRGIFFIGIIFFSCG